LPSFFIKGLRPKWLKQHKEITHSTQNKMNTMQNGGKQQRRKINTFRPINQKLDLLLESYEIEKEELSLPTRLRRTNLNHLSPDEDMSLINRRLTHDTPSESKKEENLKPSYYNESKLQSSLHEISPIAPLSDIKRDHSPETILQPKLLEQSIPIPKKIQINKDLYLLKMDDENDLHLTQNNEIKKGVKRPLTDEDTEASINKKRVLAMKEAEQDSSNKKKETIGVKRIRDGPNPSASMNEKRFKSDEVIPTVETPLLVHKATPNISTIDAIPDEDMQNTSELQIHEEEIVISSEDSVIAIDPLEAICRPQPVMQKQPQETKKQRRINFSSSKPPRSYKRLLQHAEDINVRKSLPKTILMATTAKVDKPTIPVASRFDEKKPEPIGVSNTLLGTDNISLNHKLGSTQEGPRTDLSPPVADDIPNTDKKEENKGLSFEMKPKGLISETNQTNIADSISNKFGETKPDEKKDQYVSSKFDINQTNGFNFDNLGTSKLEGKKPDNLTEPRFGYSFGKDTPLNNEMKPSDNNTFETKEKQLAEQFDGKQNAQAFNLATFVSKPPTPLAFDLNNSSSVSNNACQPNPSGQNLFQTNPFSSPDNNKPSQVSSVFNVNQVPTSQNTPILNQSGVPNNFSSISNNASQPNPSGQNLFQTNPFSSPDNNKPSQVSSVFNMNSVAPNASDGTNFPQQSKTIGFPQANLPSTPPSFATGSKFGFDTPGFVPSNSFPSNPANPFGATAQSISQNVSNQSRPSFKARRKRK
jgi:hypothetical protein